MRKFKVTKKWPGGPDVGDIITEDKATPCFVWSGCASYPINELTGFVEEIKEENRFDKAKRFPKMTYRVNAEGDVCLADFTNTDSPRAEFYANREQAEARAQLNAHIQKMGMIEQWDMYWLLDDGAWEKHRNNGTVQNYFIDPRLPIWANDEDKAERVRLFNLVYNTNF